MSRRWWVWVGLISSTLLMGALAMFLSLWRVVPQWEVGAWSMRANWWLAPETSCETLLRSYHKALDNGYSHSLNAWLNDKLEPGRSTSTVRAAILRYFALRAERARQSHGICERGPEIIGEVLTVSRQLGPRDKRAAVILMESLRQRQELKLSIEEDVPDGAKPIGQDTMSEKAWEAFHRWWELSSRERAEREPLAGTGIEIGSP
jgi:hypothetical protein